MLWLKDLVWRTNHWVADLAHVNETAWNKTKAAAKKEHKAGAYDVAMHRLQDRIARGYRILLTRGVGGAYVWCEDDETRETRRRSLRAGARATAHEREPRHPPAIRAV